LQGRLRQHLRAVDAVVEGDLADLNALLRDKGVPLIGVGGG
jgi:hypothetical protein